MSIETPKIIKRNCHYDKSGFPCGLGSGPVPNVVHTSKLSPNFNENKHAYCGLLSSMHSWGLYNERYGFSQFRSPLTFGAREARQFAPYYLDKPQVNLAAFDVG